MPCINLPTVRVRAVPLPGNPVARVGNNYAFASLGLLVRVSWGLLCFSLAVAGAVGGGSIGLFAFRNPNLPLWGRVLIPVAGFIVLYAAIWWGELVFSAFSNKNNRIFLRSGSLDTDNLLGLMARPLGVDRASVAQVRSPRPRECVGWFERAMLAVTRPPLPGWGDDHFRGFSFATRAGEVILTLHTPIERPNLAILLGQASNVTVDGERAILHPRLAGGGPVRAILLRVLDPDAVRDALSQWISDPVDDVRVPGRTPRDWLTIAWRVGFRLATVGGSIVLLINGRALT